jgi:multisubunit Na+/H+ antiporter MnhE subunit
VKLSEKRGMFILFISIFFIFFSELFAINNTLLQIIKVIALIGSLEIFLFHYISKRNLLHLLGVIGLFIIFLRELFKIL